MASVDERTEGGADTGLYAYYASLNFHLIATTSSFTDFTAGQPINVGGGEASAGSVNWIRLYNQPLDSTEVIALFQSGGPATVPEPATIGRARQ